MPDLELDWQRCGREWCLLASCDPPPHVSGVYVIWAPIPLVREGRMVYVGQGAIRASLAHHRGDEHIAHHGTRSLLVTWAPCLADARHGVVRFLAARYYPYEGGAATRAAPVSVNLPI